MYSALRIPHSAFFPNPRQVTSRELTETSHGFTNNNFPGDSFFEGQMSEVRFYQRELAADEVKDASLMGNNKLVGIWNRQTGSQFPESTGNAPLAANISGAGKTGNQTNGLTTVCSLVTAT